VWRTAVKISNLARSAAVDAVVDLFDGGPAAGTLEVRSGAAPANTTDADSGTLGATLTFSDPAFGAGANGVANANGLTPDSNVDATITPGHFRIKDSTGTVISQGTAGAAGELTITGMVGGQIIAGGTLSVSTITWTQPAGT
jgi:hypothetical protein